MTSRPKILLIGSDHHVTLLRKLILENAGYCVTFIDNVNGDALLHLDSVSFDAVILGYSIPPQERLELAAKVRKSRPKMPILAIFRIPGEQDSIANKFIYSLDGPEAMLGALKEMLSDRLAIDLDVSDKRKNQNDSKAIN